MRVWISLLAVGLMATAANAQAWNGCYGGAHLGYASTLAEATAFGTSVEFGDDGAAYGGLVGCDLQMDKVVIGGWADYSWNEGDINVLGLTAGVNNRWAVGVRAGTLINPYTLIYAKVGYTSADIDFVGDKEGIVWGGGAEFQVSGPMYLQADYSYVDLDSFAVGPVTIDADQHVARIGVLYKLNWQPTKADAKSLK